jgi:hypothetical protein
MPNRYIYQSKSIIIVVLLLILLIIPLKISLSDALKYLNIRHSMSCIGSKDSAELINVNK